MKVKAVLSFSGVATMCKGEIREVSPSPVWDELIRVGYVRVMDEPAGKEATKNGNRKSKSGVQRKKRVNG